MTAIRPLSPLRSLLGLGVLLAASAARADEIAPQPVDGKIHWVYRYEEGQRLARETGRPMFVVFRCERWLACSDFDGQVVRQDPEIAQLAEQFVCVRIQSMNGVDLDKFPFERDLTWMAFFMDAHDGIYARYGGREDHDAESHLTQASLVKVMRAVLRRHEEGRPPAETYALARPKPRTPEDIPPMRAMIARRREKCIHCHDVKVAELRHQQDLGEFERSMIFTYPMPSAVGIDVDPDDQTMVRSVQPGSPAAKAGVRSGDEIASLGGREVLSAGDMTRVLELLPQQADLPIELHRDGRSIRASLHLSGAWKRTADPSWRASVGLAGPNPGFWAKELNAAEKRAAGLPADALALKLTFLFPQHPTPIGAGLRLGDILVSIDGLRRAMTTRQLHAHCQMQHDYGDTVPVVILRDGREIELTLKLPEKPMRVD